MKGPMTQRLSLMINNKLAKGTIVIRNLVCLRYRQSLSNVVYHL